MGSRNSKGGLPAETFSGADHEVPAEAPGGPPPESVCEHDHDHEHEHEHVTLKVAELKRLLHPAPSE